MRGKIILIKIHPLYSEGIIQPFSFLQKKKKIAKIKKKIKKIGVLKIKKKLKAQLLFQPSEHSKNRSILLCPFSVLGIILHNVCIDCEIADNSGCFVFSTVHLSKNKFTSLLQQFCQTLSRNTSHSFWNHLYLIKRLKHEDNTQPAHSITVKQAVVFYPLLSNRQQNSNKTHAEIIRTFNNN